MKLPFNKKPTSNQVPGRRRTGRGDEASKSSDSAPASLEQRYAFRRNRTINGSTSADIKSSNELNAAVRSPRAITHHLSSQRRRIIGYLLAVLVSAFLLYLLLHQLIAQTVIRVPGVASLPASDRSGYQKSIDSYFASRPMERLRFMLDEPKLLSHLQAGHPEVQSVKINSLDQLGKAQIILQPRAAIARWSVDGKRQYVDARGVVFERNFGADPGLAIVDKSGVSTSGATSVASRRFLGFVGLSVGLAKDAGLEVKEIIIPSLTTRQVELKLAGVKPYFKLSVDRSVGEQMEDIARINKYLQDKGMKPEYVDVRVDGKAYYR